MNLVYQVLAARRFYLDGMNKSEIGQELGISRFRVARLLEAALRRGVVRIEVESPSEVDVVLAQRLAGQYGIRGAIVVRTHGTEEAARLQLARACAGVLAETLEASDLLGISLGWTLRATVGELPRLPAFAVVQLVGSLPGIDLSINSIDIVRRVAQRTGGAVYPLHVPIIVDSAEVATALRRDPHVDSTIQAFDRLTKAVVGIGSWRPALSAFRETLPPSIIGTLEEVGVVADICSLPIAADGTVVTATDLPDRTIAITEAQLRAVPDVLAVAGGAAKARAIDAALRSGLVHRLITDVDVARLLTDPGMP